MAFGVTTDYFGLADTKWQIQSSGIMPSASNAQALDSNGDVACEEVFGADAVYTAEYRVVSAAKDTNGYVPIDLDDYAKIGELFAIDTNTDAAVTGVEVSTINSEFPTVSVTAAKHFGDTVDQPEYTSGLEILGIKKAQGFGFSPAAGSRLVSSSASLSSQRTTVQDSQGDYAKSLVYQARLEASGELTACTGTPTATADTGYTLANAVAGATTNTGYGTGTVAVFKNITADT